MTTCTFKHFLVRRSVMLSRSLCFFLATAPAVAAPAWGQGLFIDAVASFSPGTSAGFGASSLPGIVLGPPRGAGATQGSLDIVSLGIGGSIVVRFDQPVICDGAGPDLTIFENAFHSGSPAGPIFAEYGFVAVSQDGVNFIPFPYDPVTHSGLAGQQPVLSHPDNGIDPLDPSVSGGDQFDLATVGLAWAAYVRITDVAGAIPDTGDLPQFSVPPSAGFDLDAVAAVHACDPGSPNNPTATSTATPSPTPTQPAATPTPTSTATAPVTHHDAEVRSRQPLRLRIRNGKATVIKRTRIKVRNADAIGDLPIRLSATGCPTVLVTVDFDRKAIDLQTSAVVRPGRLKAAIVTLTVASDAVDTPDADMPTSCVLTLTADANVAGNIDPTPANNVADVELQIVDLNDVD